MYIYIYIYIYISLSRAICLPVCLPACLLSSPFFDMRTWSWSTVGCGNDKLIKIHHATRQAKLMECPTAISATNHALTAVIVL